jgi:hypothetical protein
VYIVLFSILDYTPAFSRLAFAKKTPTDLFGSSISDARCHLAKFLQTLTSSHPNQVCYFNQKNKNLIFFLVFKSYDK